MVCPSYDWDGGLGHVLDYVFGDCLGDFARGIVVLEPFIRVPVDEEPEIILVRPDLDDFVPEMDFEVMVVASLDDELGFLLPEQPIGLEQGHVPD
jgi:hypothetical protein